MSIGLKCFLFPLLTFSSFSMYKTFLLIIKEFLKDRLYVLEHFWVHNKMEGKWPRFPIDFPTTTTYGLLPLAGPPTRVVHFLQLMNLHWHSSITQSSRFPSGFTLGVVHSMGLHKCVTCIHHYGITWSVFIALKILHISSSHSSWKSWYFYLMSYLWNYIVCSLSTWLLSLKNVNLRFLHGFSWLNVSVAFSIE